MNRFVRPFMMLVVGAFAARCGPTEPGVRPITSLPRPLTGAESQLVAADNRFAFRLFQEVARQAGPDSNLFISPLSVAMALGMAYNGAAGTTQQEMQRALELEGLTLDDV
ncbi:MAG TPA: serpin family protein, partial [Gemmatimonadales bacterium]|nr:serpin family protein [Gemmatimonadales bacterium]